MHSWGDENVDWNGISNAAEYIARRLRRLGRVGVRDYKEKYGTVRVYCSLGWYSLHSITHPGYVYSQYPQWLWKLDCHYGRYITRPLNWLVIPYHKWLYLDTYRRAVRKWPHLRREILSACDWPELLSSLGFHSIRTGPNSFCTLLDWAPNDTQFSIEVNWRTEKPDDGEASNNGGS